MPAARRFILAADFQMNLAPDKGKTDAKLKKELLDVIHQPLLQLALARFGRQRERTYTDL